MEKESRPEIQDKENLENSEQTKDSAENDDAEQAQREAILNEQAKRLHPEQPIATVHIGKKDTAAAVEYKQVEEIEQSRKKNRLAYFGAAAVMAAVVIVLLVTAGRALGSSGGNYALAGSAGSAAGLTADAEGSGSAGDSQTEPEPEEQQPPVETKPASQQESEQYLQIKDDTTLPAYALMYPGLYSNAVSEQNVESDRKVCYLTFDDGPSSTNTPGILDVLKAYNVKATFFLVTSEIDGNEALIQRMVDEGHTICIHANVHEYGAIYTSVEDYLADFATAYDKIYDLTGYRVQGVRFPGGSNNVVIKRHEMYTPIIQEMTRRGFEYYDWNAYDHDAEGGDYSVEQMINFAVGEVLHSNRNDTIVLMHDTYGKEKTVTALPTIIQQLQAAGIDCLPITGATRPVHFYVDDTTPPDMPVQAVPVEQPEAQPET